MQTVTNKKTSERGAFVRYCQKTVKVCVHHQKIKNAHDYRYWKISDCEVAK